MAIEIKKFQEIVSKYPNLKMEPMTAFYKIEAGQGRVYVAKTTRVTRVDISGFHFTHPAVTVLEDDLRREKRKGRVEAQLNFGKNEDQVLEAFETALRFMLALTGQEVELPQKLQREADHFVSVRLPRRAPQRAAEKRPGEEGGEPVHQ